MNKLAKLTADVTLVDTWSQNAVYGSWNFIVSAACINAAMKYVPDAPVDTGIDTFTEYEAARRALIKDAGNSQLPALLTVRRDIANLIDDANGQARGLDDTLEFLTGSAPTAKTFENDYNNRVRAGMKPAMSMKQFVEYELERAMEQYNRLVAHGEDAVRLCETFTLAEMNADDVPEWVLDSFETKLIEKLHARWEKLEFVRCNPKRRKQIRDAAEADQMLITMVLAKYDEVPGFAQEASAPVKEEALPEGADDLESLAQPVKPARTRIKASDLAEQA